MIYDFKSTIIPGVPSKPPAEEQLEEKEHICKNILSSPFGLFHFNVTQEMIQSHSLNERKDSSRNTHPELLNPYRQRSITIFGYNLTEFVFECSPKQGILGNAEYFVSRDYTALQWIRGVKWELKVVFLRGRFVFEFNDKKELVVIAIVEKPIHDVFTFPENLAVPLDKSSCKYRHLLRLVHSESNLIDWLQFLSIF